MQVVVIYQNQLIIVREKKNIIQIRIKIKKIFLECAQIIIQ